MWTGIPCYLSLVNSRFPDIQLHTIVCHVSQFEKALRKICPTCMHYTTAVHLVVRMQIVDNCKTIIIPLNLVEYCPLLACYVYNLVS